MYYIYYLEKDNVPFYIGRTISPTSRKRDHIKRFGPNIEMIIIDEVDSNVDFWEIHYMWLFHSWGYKLSNKSFKAFGPDKVSDETKNKISIGVKQNTTRNAKISQAIKGKYIGREAPWATGRPKGIKYTEEQKQKMKKPRINKWEREKLVSFNIVEEIRTKFQSGTKRSDLSREYNVSWGTIKNITDYINSYK